MTDGDAAVAGPSANANAARAGAPRLKCCRIRAHHRSAACCAAPLTRFGPSLVHISTLRCERPCSDTRRCLGPVVWCFLRDTSGTLDHPTEHLAYTSSPSPNANRASATASSNARPPERPRLIVRSAASRCSMFIVCMVTLLTVERLLLSVYFRCLCSMFIKVYEMLQDVAALRTVRVDEGGHIFDGLPFLSHPRRHPLSSPSSVTGACILLSGTCGVSILLPDSVHRCHAGCVLPACR
jgi:hypothetical protein